MLGRARRSTTARPVVTLVVSLGTAASLGVVLYLASTTLPYLASSPTTDPNFGALNQCLLDGLHEPRIGFAVAPDGNVAAAYGGGAVALCDRPADAGVTAARSHAIGGVSSAAFDFAGGLWLSAQRAGADPELWHLPRGGSPSRLPDLAPLALVGHARGVLVLDRSGRLVSLSFSGEPLAYAQLPAPAVVGAQLSSNADGTLAAVVVGSGLVVYRVEDLYRLSAEGPCQVEYLWWLPERSRAVVACAPQGDWALSVEVLSGTAETAPKKERPRSVLLAGAGLYVQGCENLPCSAPTP